MWDEICKIITERVASGIGPTQVWTSASSSWSEDCSFKTHGKNCSPDVLYRVENAFGSYV
jgi:hypothetical protein